MEKPSLLPSVAPSSDTSRETIRFAIPGLLLAIAALAFTWHFVQPAPPKRVVIATGSKSGIYYAMGKKYADFFASNGIQLEVQETGGSVENFKLLNTPDSGVDIAIVQGGSAPSPEQRPRIQAVAGIYYEPVLVFYRGDVKVTQLSQLVGKKIAIGAQGSGVRLLASLLLDEAGVSDLSRGTAWVDLGNDRAADALTAGQIDAAFYVIAADAPVITRLLQTPGVHAMSFEHAHAYGRRHPFLSAATLYQGVVDVKQNLPDADINLVAAPATLVVRENTHQAIIELLVWAAQKTNSGATLLSDPGTFPRSDRSELPINKDATYFLNNKPSILHRTLPFWLASMVDRLIIMIVPLLVVLIPMSRLIPAAYKWRMSSRILSRYKRVRQIEEKLTPGSPPTEIRTGRDQLLSLEKELSTLKLPIAFAEQLYNLRAHVAYVHAKLNGWLQPKESATSPGLQAL